MNTIADQIDELIWHDTEKALALWQSHLQLSGKGKPAAKSTTTARLQQFILYVLLEHPDLKTLNIDELQKSLKKDEAMLARFQIWNMWRHIRSDLSKANELRLLFTEKRLQTLPPEVRMTFYTFSCFYWYKIGTYEDMTRLCLETEELLKQVENKSAFHYAMGCLASNFHTYTHTNYHRFEEAHQAADRNIATAGRQNLCAYVKHLAHIEKANIYTVERKLETAVEWMEKACKQLDGQHYHVVTRYTAYGNIANQFLVKIERKLCKNEGDQKEQIKKCDAWLKRAEAIMPVRNPTSAVGFVFYVKAKMFLHAQNHVESLRAIARSVRIFYRHNQFRFLAQAYTIAYQIYHDLAVKHRSYPYSLRAAHASERMRLMSDTYYRQILKERIEGIELKYQLRETELKEKLLKHQVDSMNKEMQLTQLNLHEKIMVLDELKTYVHSLKRKELETRQLINTIAKKIDTVKITEEDKAVLQQKMSDTSQLFSQKLSEKYPSLSNLEIRMCVLFKTGITNKELAKLYGLSERSYELHRYRIKKKMGLTADDNLVKHLIALSNPSTQ